MLRMNVFILFVISIGLLMTACASPAEPSTNTPSSVSTEPSSEPVAPQAEYKEQPVNQPQTTNPVVIIETTQGTVTVELWPDKSPKTVANFLGYVDDGFFDGTIFHRVIPGFMIQGGGFTADMKQKPTRPPVVNEARSDVPNDRGTIAMARTGDPHSATAQFFINHADNAFLNHSSNTPQGFGYCVFGKVIDGMDVVDAIAEVPTTRLGPYDDVPAQTVKIVSVRRHQAVE